MNLLHTAIEAAEKAGEAIMQIYAEDDFDIKSKADDSPVTKADLKANEVISTILKKTGIPILSEESKDDLSRTNSDKVWIIDPIDGTKDFIQKNGEFCIMIGLAVNGISEIGVINCPAIDKLYYAQKDQGAFLRQSKQDKQIQVSNTQSISDAKLVVSRSHFSDKFKAMVENLNPKEFVQMGSNGLKIGLVSEGGADFQFNPTRHLSEWDICAADIIVTEAGGTISAVNRDRLEYNKEVPKFPNGTLCSNGVLHDAIVEKLSESIH